MFSAWSKMFAGRKIPSTAAVALAAALAPHCGNAKIVTDNGGSSPSNPDYVGNITVGDEISFVGATLPAYWEFTWEGASRADISSQGTFASTYLGDDNPYQNLQLYTASGTPPNMTASLIDSSAFAETNFVPSTGYMGTGYVDADLGNVALTPGAEYVVGISAQTTDPTGTVNFNAATVPEPASLTLLGSFVTGFGLLRRRRRRFRS